MRKLLVVLLLGLPAWLVLAQETEKPAGDVSIILEIQRLSTPDQTIEDDQQRQEAHMQSLQKVPALAEGLEKHFPKSQHIPLARSMALDALRMRFNGNDPAVTLDDISKSAHKLAAVGLEDRYQAKAQYVLLELLALDAMGTATSAPTTASTPTTSGPTTGTAASGPTTKSVPKMLRAADGFVEFAEKYGKTDFAPVALFMAGGLYLECQRTDTAVAAYNRLSRNHPKDAYALKALMLLVQLYDEQGKAAQASEAKRRVVENFADTDIGMQYKSDLALADNMGKPFFLRFKAADGRDVDVRAHKGKTVLVYFYSSLADETLGPAVVKNMQELAKLADEKKAVLLAIGADAETDADAVAKILKDKKIDTPNLVDPALKIAQQYGVIMVPCVLVIDKDGNLCRSIAAADIISAVKKTLAEPTSKPASGPSTPKK